MMIFHGLKYIFFLTYFLFCCGHLPNGVDIDNNEEETTHYPVYNFETETPGLYKRKYLYDGRSTTLEIDVFDCDPQYSEDQPELSNSRWRVAPLNDKCEIYLSFPDEEEGSYRLQEYCAFDRVKNKKIILHIPSNGYSHPYIGDPICMTSDFPLPLRNEEQIFCGDLKYPDEPLSGFEKGYYKCVEK